MVEMAETANILHHATDRSLVLLDEIGRGTATFDGLSIAWAVSEHLACDLQARTVFATHYHELNALSRERNNVANFQVLVEETGDDLVFLHQVSPGGASRSYGIEAATIHPGWVIHAWNTPPACRPAWCNGARQGDHSWISLAAIRTPDAPVTSTLQA